MFCCLTSPVTSDNKTLWVNFSYEQFRKELILIAFQRQNYYYRILYIIFKSSSSKYNEVSHYHISYKGTSCILKYFPRSAEWQWLTLYKHTGSNQKLTEQPGLTQRRGIRYLSQQHGVSVLTTKPSCLTWGLRPYYQPKQNTWNPINHIHGPSTGNQTSLLFFSFKQLFSELNSESLTIFNSNSESILRSLLVSSLHFLVTGICRPAPASPAAVPAPTSYLHLQASSTMRRQCSSQQQLQTSFSLT